MLLLVVFTAAATLAASIILVAAAPDAPPVLSSAYDVSAFLVPPSQAASLQLLLDKHGSVRLLPGDYQANCTTTRPPHHPPVTNCSFPPANLTVRTGQRVWGLPGARIPGVVIEPGAEGVVLSGLNFAGQPLYFPPGSSTTQFSTFHRLNGPHVVFAAGSKVADLSFVGMTELGCGPECGGRTTWHTTAFSVGGIHAEAGSSVRNCKFIRSMVHAPWPLLTVRTKQWVGNTFLWTNVLGALQSSFSETDAAELTVVGPDMETYGACWMKPAIEAEKVGSVRLFGPHGRLDCHPQNSSMPPPTPIMALDATNVWISSPMDLPVSRPAAQNADILLGRSVENYVRVDRGLDAPWTTQQGVGAGPIPFRLWLSSNNTVTLGNGSRSRSGGGGALPAAAQAALGKMVASPTGGTWAVAPKPSPMPPLPSATASSSRDDTAKLQAMIDSWVTSPTAPQIVPAGTYYISATLRVGRLPDPDGNTTACLAQTGVRMLIGAGEDSVFILAKDPSMTMVTSDGCWPNGGGNATAGPDQWRSESSRFHVVGLTLAGGAVGLHLSAATGHLQISDSLISHLRFRELSKYGIWLDDIYGLDNNLLSFLAFDKCRVAFYQRAPDSQRVAPGSFCKPAWNNPYLGYVSSFRACSCSERLYQKREIVSEERDCVRRERLCRNSSPSLQCWARFWQQGAQAWHPCLLPRHASAVGHNANRVPNGPQMDKVVFYRIQVTNCQTGFQLDACREDNLNYWVENSVSNISGSGWDLHSTSEAAIVSSHVENVGEMNGGDTSVREAGGSGVCVINSRMIAGPDTKYMLANDAKIEGSTFELGASASVDASLFQPPPRPPAHRGLHAGTNFRFQSWPSVSMSRTHVSTGLTMPKLLRESVLFNNQFEEPADRDLNKAAVVVNGSVTTTLAEAPSELAPTSALCFGPGW